MFSLFKRKLARRRMKVSHRNIDLPIRVIAGQFIVIDTSRYHPIEFFVRTKLFRDLLEDIQLIDIRMYRDSLRLIGTNGNVGSDDGKDHVFPDEAFPTIHRFYRPDLSVPELMRLRLEMGEDQKVFAEEALEAMNSRQSVMVALTGNMSHESDLMREALLESLRLTKSYVETLGNGDPRPAVMVDFHTKEECPAIYEALLELNALGCGIIALRMVSDSYPTVDVAADLHIVERFDFADFIDRTNQAMLISGEVVTILYARDYKTSRQRGNRAIDPQNPILSYNRLHEEKAG